MDTGKNKLSEDIIKQILSDEKLRNEILEKAAKDPAMQEKLNNHCCISYPVPSSIVPSPFSVTGCEINYHEKYNRDCKYYDEEHDMGATIPICTKYDKFSDFNCNECYKYKR